MFGYFINFDADVFHRYSTLENNLRSASNSFYDSYRATVESFLKFIKNKYNISNGGRDGIQSLFNNDELLRFLYTAGVEERAISKVKDYILKINKHIHKKEKELGFEIVVDYLNALYDLTAPVAYFMGQTPKRITLDEIQKLYAEYETNLKAQNMFHENLEDCIDKKFEEFKDSMNSKNKEPQISMQKAREYFLNNSNKTLIYRGEDSDFSFFKLVYTLSLSLFLLLSFIQLYLMFAYERVMFVYDLPINIVYAMLFARIFFLKKEMNPLSLDTYSMYSVMPIGPLWTLDGIKKRYIGFGILSLVIFVFDLSFSFEEKVLPTGSIIVEVLHTSLMLFLTIYGIFHFRKYDILKMAGLDLITKQPKVEFIK